MQSQSRFFDDIARVAAGAVGTLSGVRSEVEARLREQLERVLAGMDLVTRDEFYDKINGGAIRLQMRARPERAVKPPVIRQIDQRISAVPRALPR